MATQFENPAFQFEFELALGMAARRGGDIGEMLVTAAAITDGDAESWHTAWATLAARTEATARASAEQGHRVSARDTYLRAAAYFVAAMGFLEGSDDPDRLLPTWEAHRACWDRAVDHFDPPVEHLEIPFEDTTLPGYFFPAGEGRRPALVLVNGSDGPDVAMWCMYGADACARGYHCLLVDGPGQQAALFRQGLHFIPDWERVVSPSVDWLVGRDDVDADHIAMLGCSQGGHWAPRAAAFEPRIAACVADPGVFDCGRTWTGQLPPDAAQLLADGDRDGFDAYMHAAFDAVPPLRQSWASRSRPYGLTSPFDLYRAVSQYTLDGVVDRITCPTLVCDPEDEQFWPGEPRRLYDALTCPKELARFTTAEGAGHHCEPLATGLRNQRVFDWLDGVLGR